MSKSLQKWLSSVLNVNLRVDDEDLGLKQNAALLIVEILHKFEKITTNQWEQFTTTGTIDSPLVLFNCLHRTLADHWPITEADLIRTINGDRATILRILETLYAHLTTPTGKQAHKFTVSEVVGAPPLPHQHGSRKPSSPQASSDFLVRRNPLAEPILEQWDLIGWYRDHLTALRRQSERIREKYERFLLEKKLQQKRVTTVAPSPATSDHYQRDVWTVALTNDSDSSIDSSCDTLGRHFPIPPDLGYEQLFREQTITTQGPITAEIRVEEAQCVLRRIRRRRVEREARIQREQLQNEAVRAALERLRIEQKERFAGVMVKKLQRPTQLEQVISSELDGFVEQQEALMRFNADLMARIQRERDDEAFIRALLEDDLDGTLRFWQERQLKLAEHARLYAERLAAKQRKREQMCRDVVHDLIDLALCHAEYKQKYGGLEPNYWRRQSWSRLFIYQLPIFDFVTPIGRIRDDEEFPTTPSEGFDTEEWPDLDPEFVQQETERQNALNQVEFQDYLRLVDEFDVIWRGGNILGHVIHHILLIKYPDVVPVRPRFSDQLKMVVCVQAFDLDQVNQFQDLLPKQMPIIRIDDGIQFCINTYEREFDDVEQIDLFITELQGRPRAKSPGKKKEKKRKKSPKKQAKKKKGSDKATSSKGSKKSKGKKTESEPDSIAVTNKENEDEECQTPRLFPDEKIYTERAQLGKALKELAEPHSVLYARALIEYLDSLKNLNGFVLINYPQNIEEAFDLEQHLSGKLIPKSSTGHYPHQFSKLYPAPTDGPPYLTFLTSFVRLVAKDQFDLDVVFGDSELTDLDRFYAQQEHGILFDYQILDRDTLLKLANRLIEQCRKVDTTKPQASVVVEEPPSTARSTGSKKKKKNQKKPPGSPKSTTASSKKSKKSKDKKKTKGSTPRSTVGMDSKEVQVPDLEEPIGTQLVEVEKPKPGTLNWSYVPIELPGQDFGVSLATEWELIEGNYIETVQNTMFKVRRINSAIETYLVNAQKRMRHQMSQPDRKQMFLSEFQMIFNELIAQMALETNTQCVEETKHEICIRLNELKRKLMDLCDVSMRTEAQYRITLMEEGWFGQQMCTLTSCCVKHLYAELCRHLATLQLITDYYTSYVTKQTLRNRSFVVNVTLDDSALTVCQQYCDQLVDGAVDKAEKLFHTTRSSLNVKLKTLNEMKRYEFDGPHQLQLVDQTVFEEWQCALESEHARIKFYIQWLCQKCGDDIEHLNRLKDSTYQLLYEAIRDKYEVELHRVETACWILQRALHEQIAITPELLLDRTISCTAISIFPKIQSSRDSISLTQLDNMVNVLVSLAPNGLVALPTLISLFQEWIVEEAIPLSWRKLSRNDLRDLLDQIFDTERSDLVPWRDFIVTMLPVATPSRDQILQIRDELRTIDAHQLELITEQELVTIPLWFEHPVVKQLLYKMYRMQNGSFNYTAMLLDFCKDQYDPLEGLLKAIEMSLGRRLCTDQVHGDWFLQEELERRRNEERRIIKEECFEMIRNTVEQAMRNPLGFEDELWNSFLLRLQRQQIAEELDAVKEDCYKAICHLVETCTERPDQFYDANLWDRMRQRVLTVTPPTPTNTIVQLDETSTTLQSPIEGVTMGDTQYEYFVPFELLSTVLSAALPWSTHAQHMGASSFQQMVHDSYDACKTVELEGADVLAHVFFNSPHVHQLFANIRKFCRVNVGALVCVLNRQMS